MTDSSKKAASSTNTENKNTINKAINENEQQTSAASKESILRLFEQE